MTLYYFYSPICQIKKMIIFTKGKRFVGYSKKYSL